MRNFASFFCAFVFIACESESSFEASPEQIDIPQVMADEPLVIGLSKSTFTADDIMEVSIYNPSKATKKVGDLILEREGEPGQWQLIRGRLVCPCLTDCFDETIVVLPQETHTYTFENFYQIKGVSLPHTVFCGMMRPAQFRIRIRNQKDAAPAKFLWE